MQTIKRCLDILELLSNNTNGIGISELSLKTNLAKSTIHRILQSLMEYNMVSQDDETRKYRLGLGTFILGSKALETISIRDIVHPYLMSLRDEFNATAFLAVLSNDKVICVEKFDSPKKLRYFVDIGTNMPAHCAASAKAIMAYQDQEFLEGVVSELELYRYSNNTITTREDLLSEYKIIKNRGYSVCDNEMEDLVIGISAPIFDWDNKVRSSICILGLNTYLEGNTFEKAVIKIVEMADEISNIWGKVKKIQ